jgi:hypothetical protein
MIDPILEYAAQHPGQVAGAVATLGAAGFHTLKTGRVPLGRLPWRATRDIVQELREQYYGRPRPRGVPALLVDADVATLETALRDKHFEGTPAAYDYNGEVLNLRRPAGVKRHPKTGAEVPMELHPRAFETADSGLLVIAHLEASRYEATGEHLSEGMLSWETGQGMLASTLHNETDLDHETIASERDAGVEVV